MNAALLQNMIDAMWTYLGAADLYADLALTEFRLTDGRRLPVDEEGHLHSTDLPAIYVGSVTPEVEEQTVEPDATDEIRLTLDMGVVYATNDSYTAYPALAAMAAVLTIQDVLCSAEARTSRLGAAGSITDYGIGLGEVRPVPTPGAPGNVLYWDAEFSVQLIKRRIFPAS